MIEVDLINSMTDSTPKIKEGKPFLNLSPVLQFLVKNKKIKGKAFVLDFPSFFVLEKPEMPRHHIDN